MSRLIILFSVILMTSNLFSQKMESEINQLRKEHSETLSNPDSKVLTPKEIKNFGGLDYFEFDTTFQIKARFKKRRGPKFEMPTSTDRKPTYRRYGIVYFEIDGKECQLEVYQNIELMENEEYKDYLFIPFRDATTALTTYGAGRYIDLRKSKSKTIWIDFNTAYNPYCAYSYRYSCPIPPEINSLEVEIMAGEKTPLEH